MPCRLACVVAGVLACNACSLTAYQDRAPEPLTLYPSPGEGSEIGVEQSFRVEASFDGDDRVMNDLVDGGCSDGSCLFRVDADRRRIHLVPLREDVHLELEAVSERGTWRHGSIAWRAVRPRRSVVVQQLNGLFLDGGVLLVGARLRVFVAGADGNPRGPVPPLPHALELRSTPPSLLDFEHRAANGVDPAMLFAVARAPGTAQIDLHGSAGRVDLEPQVPIEIAATRDIAEQWLMDSCGSTKPSGCTPTRSLRARRSGGRWSLNVHSTFRTTGGRFGIGGVNALRVVGLDDAGATVDVAPGRTSATIWWDRAPSAATRIVTGLGMPRSYEVELSCTGDPDCAGVEGRPRCGTSPMGEPVCSP